MVCGWAHQQIPLKVVYTSIDRLCERLAAKGGRRRPIRIELCEAEVLDRFDEWRRAVGVGAATEPGNASRRARRSLTQHVAEVIDRLTAWSERDETPAALAEAVVRTLPDLHAILQRGGSARGEGRQELLRGLRRIQESLVTSLRESMDVALHQQLRTEAARDLEPFRARMAPATFRDSVDAATDRLLCEQMKFPQIVFE